MAATGQRIHPAGSRRPNPTPASPRRGGARCPAANTTPAASASWPARPGARSHEVVSMALEAVARVAHRGAASTDNSGDGAGLLTQIPYRLFYRDAYRLGSTCSRACPSASAPSSCRATRRHSASPCG